MFATATEKHQRVFTLYRYLAHYVDIRLLLKSVQCVCVCVCVCVHVCDILDQYTYGKELTVIDNGELLLLVS